MPTMAIPFEKKGIMNLLVSHDPIFLTAADHARLHVLAKH
jgi:hypothetical protein